MIKFPHYRQQDKMDCGPTCLRMISKYYGRTFPIQKLRQLCHIQRGGVTLLDISEAAEKIGFRTAGVKLSIDQLTEVGLPCILHWRQSHFVILYKIKKGKFYIADPAAGLFCLSQDEFKKNWFAHKEMYDGISLLFAVSPKFYDNEEDTASTKLNWLAVLRYFYAYRKLIIQLIFGLVVGSLLSMITPFFSQVMVDYGINDRNISIVYLILIAQIMLFIGSTSVNFIRSWVLLHMSTRVNLAILTDFLIKLMNLPVSYFETKTTGDITQRMSDQQKIESFLTGTTLSTVFSMFNLIIFTFILLHYNPTIFLISFISTILYVGWVLIFLKRRRELNYKQFENSATNSTTVVELIKGIQDIKLNNAERYRRWGWEQVQAKLFKFKIKSMALNQYQQSGSIIINQTKSMLITFISVTAVIKGDLTLGGMMAVQYIVGQVNSPIEQFLGFIQSYQDAKISLERLNEVYEVPDEEGLDRTWMSRLPDDRSINIENITFRYPGAGNEPVLENLSLFIPGGKITAIVGMSGSGKTTILKMLLRFYEPEKGEIRVGKSKLNRISYKVWREKCGAVTQNGHIFADTIAGNIAIGDEFPDDDKLQKAIDIANLSTFIEDQPFGLITKIGAGGNGISQGQKQRIFIARAVYKNPEYLFFDEATNSLDANNELVIMNNMKEFYKGKTVVIVAHRLSTVMNADNIIVLTGGCIKEQGTHEQLTKLKGEYYELVKNQLELGRS